MIRVPINNVGITRTVKAEYPGLPWGMQLHPDWDRSIDILPGTVMARIDGETVAPYGQTFGDIVDVSGQVPFGLSALFCAPALGVDETRASNDFTVWVGGKDAVFRILKGAYDENANWSTPADGSKQFVYANANAQLTTTVAGQPVGALITDGTADGFIRVSLDNIPVVESASGVQSTVGNFSMKALIAGDGTDADDFAGKKFPVTASWTVDGVSSSKTFELPVGATALSGVSLPENTEITMSEGTPPEAPVGYTFVSATASAATITIVAGTTTAWTLTNTYSV